MTLILASSSPFRASILRNAGLQFQVDAAHVDERSVEAPLLESGATPDDIATVLAETKAMEVAERHPGAIVIGGDQTLSLDGELLHKPPDMEHARHQLLKLSGREHQLSSAIVLVQDNKTLWRYVAVAHMHVRDLSPRFVGHYLARTGNMALQSVGCYQYENLGIQLFDRIDGDYFTIVGLPVLPLLAELRTLGEIDG